MPRLLRDLPREVGVLTAVAFAVAVGFGVVAPAIPVFAREFGVGVTAAGAVISAFALMRLVSALAGGRLVDRFGERTVLATGIGIVAVSSLLAGLAQNYIQLLGLRGVGGIGSAMFTVSAYTLLLRVAGPEQRGRASGLFQSGFLIGGIAGPFIGGVLTSISIRAPFFVYAGTLAVAGLIGIVFLSHARLDDTPRTDDDVPQRTGLAAALRNSAYRAALTTNFAVGWSLFGVRASLIPLFVIEGLRRDAIWIGIGFAISAIAQALTLLPAGRFVDTVGRRPAMIFGGALAAVSMLLLALDGSVVAYGVSMLLFGIASGFLGTAPAAVVGDVVTGRGGTVVAAFQMASDLGAIIGPILAGWLVDGYSYSTAWLATAAVLAVATLASAFAPETQRRQSSPAAP
ncbi:MAG TPA: MFS transporter [Actinomycetes bacterium]|nr:MFS transporter [Actinomycetes bacterium]